MNCCLSVADLDQYHGGQLSDADSSRIRDHLQACRSCAALDHNLVAANERLMPCVQAMGQAGVAAGASDPASVPTSAPDDAEDSDAAAPEIPGYRILRRLHRGGQGVVYLAHQTSTKRKVAIKVMATGRFASPSAQKRFEREIEIVAQLKHANIISIFHSGRMPDGLQFYVMDYIRGQRVDHYVHEKKLGLRDTLKLFADICEAVQYAHQRGVIHRDLKPSNVMVDSEGRPRVLDFGLAKMLASPEESVVSLTAEIIGTLPYMSPEQARGTSDEVDTRTDIYALGVMLYEVLTGAYPYPVVGNIADILHNITDTPPTPPSRVWDSKSGVHADHSRGLRSGRCPIDNEVQTIVLKALSKQRERRYQSAGELGRDLRHYVANEPIEAKRDSALYVLRKRLHRHRAKVAVAATFGLLLVCFGAYARANQLQDSIDGHLKRGGELRDRKQYALALEEFNAALSLEPDNYDAMMLKAYLLHEMYRDRDYSYAAPESLRETVTLCETASELKADRHGPWNLRCVMHYYLGELDEAEQACRECLKLKPDYFYAWSNLGRVLALQHRFKEAREALENGIRWLEELPKEEVRTAWDDNMYRAYAELLLFLADESAPAAIGRALEIESLDHRNQWVAARLALTEQFYDAQKALDYVDFALGLYRIDDPRLSRIAALAFLRNDKPALAKQHAEAVIRGSQAPAGAVQTALQKLGSDVHATYGHVLKAMALAELGQAHEASAELDQALQGWPDFPEDGVFVESEKELLWIDREDELEALVAEAQQLLGLERK